MNSEDSDSTRKTIQEVHQEILRRGIPAPETLEKFLDVIDEAVRKSGEGMKIMGGTPREYGITCLSGVRFREFTRYLNYLQVGEEDYNHLVSMLTGEKAWKSWARFNFRYSPESSLNPNFRKLFEES